MPRRANWDTSGTSSAIPPDPQPGPTIDPRDPGGATSKTEPLLIHQRGAGARAMRTTEPFGPAHPRSGPQASSLRTGVSECAGLRNALVPCHHGIPQSGRTCFRRAVHLYNLRAVSCLVTARRYFVPRLKRPFMLIVRRGAHQSGQTGHRASGCFPLFCVERSLLRFAVTEGLFRETCRSSLIGLEPARHLRPSTGSGAPTESIA